jgi:hypothetical protein
MWIERQQTPMGLQVDYMRMGMSERSAAARCILTVREVVA